MKNTIEIFVFLIFCFLHLILAFNEIYEKLKDCLYFNSLTCLFHDGFHGLRNLVTGFIGIAAVVLDKRVYLACNILLNACFVTNFANGVYGKVFKDFSQLYILILPSLSIVAAVRASIHIENDDKDKNEILGESSLATKDEKFQKIEKERSKENRVSSEIEAQIRDKLETKSEPWPILKSDSKTPLSQEVKSKLEPQNLLFPKTVIKDDDQSDEFPPVSELRVTRSFKRDFTSKVGQPSNLKPKIENQNKLHDETSLPSLSRQEVFSKPRPKIDVISEPKTSLFEAQQNKVIETRKTDLEKVRRVSEIEQSSRKSKTQVESSNLRKTESGMRTLKKDASLKVEKRKVKFFTQSEPKVILIAGGQHENDFSSKVEHGEIEVTKMTQSDTKPTQIDSKDKIEPLLKSLPRQNLKSKSESTSAKKAAITEGLSATFEEIGTEKRMKPLRQIDFASAKIGFVGAGLITRHLIDCLIGRMRIAPQRIYVSAPSTKNLSKLEALGCTVTTKNIQIFSKYKCELVFICCRGNAIKPKSLFLEENIPIENYPSVVLSVVSQVKMDKIRSFFNLESSLNYRIEFHRFVVDYAFTHGLGICIVDSDPCNEKELSAPLKTMFSKFGSLEHVEESEMDILCSLMSSGSAITFYFMAALTNEATALGLNLVDAIKCSGFTCLSASNCLLKVNKHPNTLIEHLTSNQSPALYGIETLKNFKFATSVSNSIEESYRKMMELSKNTLIFSPAPLNT
ncbi:pyrroline-5-carboxylate reductase-like protein 1 [Dinothrombium tinctorium]|uniref:Pyrroline-5-carboxylate reductase-like protein 1 n=1 Tax=Dinothrombium tinctorium TaxID=1965070 RepID=A0A3S3NKQ1_9ACAR|nr:pyrroline-5-carboxylate reductase-like protein 1 [Dinothrombium tinctorium]